MGCTWALLCLFDFGDNVHSAENFAEDLALEGRLGGGDTT
jgi:hypothetical protein